MKGYIAMILISAVASTSSPDAVLPPCPSSPNCVPSLASDGHRIKPFLIAGDPHAGFDRLREIIAARKDTPTISADSETIRLEFFTTLGFTDDGLFVLDAGRGIIHVRSAAKTGYWNLGKNRRRMGEICREFAK